MFYYFIEYHRAQLNTPASILSPRVAGYAFSFLIFATESSYSPISHVVMIFQENRTPDNLFQDSVLVARGADIASSGINSHGQTVPLAPVSLANRYDLSHMHQAFVDMYDGGKMDGADFIQVVCIPHAVNCPPPNPQFTYVPPSEVQPYFALAEQYTFADRMFQTNQGPSFPAHQFILAGTSAPSAGSNLFAAENPFEVNDTGCTANAGQTVALIDPSGVESTTGFPCYEHSTLADLLDAKGLTWHYYSPLPGSIWTAPNAIDHLCQPQSIEGTPTCTSPDWLSNVIISKPRC